MLYFIMFLDLSVTHDWHYHATLSLCVSDITLLIVDDSWLS